MTALQHIIPSVIGDRPGDAALQARQTATYGARPPLRARTTWTGAGLTRTLTVQVTNQRAADCKGHYLVCVLLGTDGGSATPTFTVSAGTELEQFSEVQGGLFITDEDGKLTLSVTQSGSWTALVERATALSLIDGPTATAWAGNAGTGGGGGGGTTVRSGSVTVDFGSPHEGGTAVVTVTGQTWVTADAIITATAPAVASADHDAIDAALEGLTCHVGNIVAGTGFDITVSAREGTWGRFTIHWLGIDP